MPFTPDGVSRTKAALVLGFPRLVFRKQQESFGVPFEHFRMPLTVVVLTQPSLEWRANHETSGNETSACSGDRTADHVMRRLGRWQCLGGHTRPYPPGQDPSPRLPGGCAAIFI